MLALRIWLAALPKVVRFLITMHVLVYLVSALVLWRISPIADFMWGHLALSTSWWREPWQLITYTLINPGSFRGLLHFAFGLLWLYWMGRDLEDLRGSAMILALWVLCAAGGGAVAMLLAPIVLPGQAQLVAYTMWGPVLGIVAAVCTWDPDKRIGLFPGILLKVIYLVCAFLALELLLRPAGSGSALVSFSGAACGVVFVLLVRRGVNVYSWAEALLGSPSKWLDRMESRLSHPPGRTNQTATELEEDDVDRILDKINAEGMDALTNEERRILEEASRQ